MTRRKLRLLFDATALSGGLRGGDSRSGIFRTAYEILIELASRNDVEIGLYADRRYAAAVHAVLDKRQGGFWQEVRFWLEARHAPPKGKRGRGLMPFLWFLYRVMRWIVLFVPRRICDRRSTWNYVRSERDFTSYDAYLSLLYAAPQEIVESQIPRWTVFYDTLVRRYPRFYPPPEGDWWRELIAGMTAEDLGFAISECTKRDVLEACPVLRAENLHVIPLAAGDRFRPVADEDACSRVRRKYGIPDGKRYFLSCCTLEPRKNIPNAVRAFRRMLAESPAASDVVFVIVGGIWDSYRSEWERFCREMAGIGDRIVRVGYVDDIDQPVLYSDAVALVYTSLYEGFGLPPLEAMQCGCPAIVSDTSSLPEVVGDAGMPCPPDDIGAIAGAMRFLLENGAARREFSERGLIRARKFSWANAAEIIVQGIQTRLTPLEQTA